ncbi:Beta-lactamase OXA-5 [Halomicronema hongdechloris C2206]|uniref:Beta-lactamase n=1 Tax=Halomicronema hongdechloris C2206 TaxID=1641165 RepID=A0A1Z3HNQ8_9CYAN|nr:class D beta-lactamase [Halomicronema hongdechloris]ASC71929.1 Beta-lactamase OXA-5 [Halomicronema hongdechloris C2206]
MICVPKWFGGLVAGSVMTIVAQPALAEAGVQPVTPLLAQQEVPAQVDFAPHFQDLGIEGSIIIYDLNLNQTYQHNSERNSTPYLPGSTFKILNSLISLEAGVIDNDLAILTWDGVERIVPAWNRDLNMRTAFPLSAVWFYQVLARRVGHDRMQQSVAEAGYGNQDIGSAEDIDTFWLTGDLRTTPEEQIDFLRRLYNDDVPFSEDVIALGKDIMIVEQTPDYTIRAKTGWVGFGEPDQEQIGWYVGYVEQADNVYFFATNIDIRDEDDPAARVEVTRRCLETLQLL